MDNNLPKPSIVYQLNSSIDIDTTLTFEDTLLHSNDKLNSIPAQYGDFVNSYFVKCDPVSTSRIESGSFSDECTVITGDIDIANNNYSHAKNSLSDLSASHTQIGDSPANSDEEDDNLNHRQLLQKARQYGKNQIGYSNLNNNIVVDTDDPIPNKNSVANQFENGDIPITHNQNGCFTTSDQSPVIDNPLVMQEIIPGVADVNIDKNNIFIHKTSAFQPLPPITHNFAEKMLERIKVNEILGLNAVPAKSSESSMKITKVIPIFIKHSQRKTNEECKKEQSGKEVVKINVANFLANLPDEYVRKIWRRKISTIRECKRVRHINDAFEVLRLHIPKLKK